MLQASVTSYVDAPAGHSEYVVVSELDGRRFVARHRYSHFLKLHRAVYEPLGLPATFPISKRLLHSRSVKQRRVRSLDAWITKAARAAVANAPTNATLSLLQFLGVQPGLGPPGAGEAALLKIGFRGAAAPEEGGVDRTSEGSSSSAIVPAGEADFELSRDVYATAFVLGSNATEGMYSFSPFANRQMRLLWLVRECHHHWPQRPVPTTMQPQRLTTTCVPRQYLAFIVASQAFVLLSLVFVHPTVVDQTSHLIDCNASPMPLPARRALEAAVASAAAAEARAAAGRGWWQLAAGAAVGGSNWASRYGTRLVAGELSRDVRDWVQQLALSDWSHLAAAYWSHLTLADWSSALLPTDWWQRTVGKAQEILDGAWAAAASIPSNGTAGSNGGGGGGEGGGGRGLSPAARALCSSLETELVVPLPNGRRASYRRLSRPTYFYQNVFGAAGDEGGASASLILLQIVCCVWVSVQVYFVDVTSVESLLAFRDFNSWLLPLKGETPRRNRWVLCLPLLQFALACAIVAVSCVITCACTSGFDAVMNSLAFTFISTVAEVFNTPLLRHYSQTPIRDLDPLQYGSEPIYYLVAEYDEANAYGGDRWLESWYIRQEERVAGLLTDFHFRHTPGAYPTPHRRIVRVLRLVFFCVPLAALAGCRALN